MEKEPKSIFIDVYTDWCGWCKRMDASTFKDVEVIKLLNTYFYPVKFNAEQKGDVNFKGYNFKYVNRGRRGVNELASTLLDDKLSYPSYVALNEKYERITIIKGYQTTSDFLPMLRYLGEKHYLTQNWKDFRVSVKGD
jgi:thioredoxin-related protein